MFAVRKNLAGCARHEVFEVNHLWHIIFTGSLAKGIAKERGKREGKRQRQFRKQFFSLRHKSQRICVWQNSIMVINLVKVLPELEEA